MNTIIAPTDFSPHSLNAVNYAADMAQSMNASLLLLHVCQLPMAFNEMPVSVENITDQQKEAEEKIEQLKEEMLKRSDQSLEIITVVRSGIIVSEIVNLCKEIHPHAAVMGTHGSGALERFLFGSNTILAMKNLSIPMIVVPPNAQFTGIRKIGLACDMKKTVEAQLVDEIRIFTETFGSELYVLHVNAVTDRLYGSDIMEHAGILTRALKDFHPIYHLLSDAEIEEGLAEFTEKNNLDMLIVVPRKHSFMDRLLLRSHAREVILHAHVPVMSIHE